MAPAAKRIAEAMYLNIARRTNKRVTLAECNGQRYIPHYALLCAMLDAMRWPNRALL